MADFKPDRELEFKEFNETFKPTKVNRSPRDIYNTWPTWAKNLAKILVGIIIIIILVLIGRSIHHHSGQNAKNTRSNTSAMNKKTATSPSPAKTGNSGSGATSKTGNSSSSATSPATGTSGKSGQIANTGPGDVAALFLGAASAGTGAHYVISRRRA